MACLSALFFTSVLLIFAAANPSPLLADQAFLRVAAETNVNQHYTIESISIAGVMVEEAKLPPTLRSRFTALVGERCDVARLQELASDLRRELHLRAVSQRLLRGSEPGRVRVNFEIIPGELSFDLSIPSIRYSSQQQWSGELAAHGRAGKNTIALSVLTNGDELVERFSGISARYEYTKLGTDRLRFGLDFEDYQTDRADYRTRRNIAPQLTFAVARPLTISAGLSFEDMKRNAGAGHAAANAVTARIRYGRKIEGATVQQKANAQYDLRAGTQQLGSDFSYTRHTVSMRYEVKSGRNTASDELTAGGIAGQAPSFEKFVLGPHFAPDPTGGTRLIHNALSYGYQVGERTGEAFYDAGTLGRGARHSAGVAYRQGIFIVAMAFPLGEKHLSPVFMAGMNY